MNLKIIRKVRKTHNELIGISENHIFMRINLIEIESEGDFIIPSIQQVGDDILERYTTITNGKECSLNDEIVVLNIKLLNE